MVAVATDPLEAELAGGALGDHQLGLGLLPPALQGAVEAAQVVAAQRGWEQRHAEQGDAQHRGPSQPAGGGGGEQEPRSDVGCQCMEQLQTWPVRGYLFRPCLGFR